MSYLRASHAPSPSSPLFAQASQGGDLVVRAGYFGLCVKTGSEGTWVCARSAYGIRSILAGTEPDPLNALGVAAHFKSDVVFPGLL